HLVNNLGSDVPRSHVIPFLTCKHTVEYSLAYADRARYHGFEALVVLGGDKHIGPPRCVEHAWQLRERIRARDAHLQLGGWANPRAGMTIPKATRLSVIGGRLSVVGCRSPVVRSVGSRLVAPRRIGDDVNPGELQRRKCHAAGATVRPPTRHPTTEIRPPVTD